MVLRGERPLPGISLGASEGSQLTRGLRRVRNAFSIAAFTLVLAACAGTGGSPSGDIFSSQPVEAPPQTANNIGGGQIRVGLILPLSAQGNAGIAAQSMKNAAELALNEFKDPNIQLLVKDDAGTPQGAQLAAQQAIDEGAELIVGPLFAQSVSAVGAVARTRNIPVIAFSTDASVATRGVYLLSFLPESDVRRIVDYAASRGKRSFAAMLPDNAYGGVVEAALVKTQGAQRFSEQILTNSSGFAGIDGIFRFRSDGTSERGLSVLQVAPGGGRVVSPAPKSFTPGT